MKLQELLLLKLRNDLQEALMKEYKDTKKLQSYSEDEFKLLITQLITNKTKDLKITIDSAPVTISNKRHQCCARIYTKSRHMESRCSSKCFGNTEYCKTHLNRLNREGYGRIYESPKGKMRGAQEIANKLQDTKDPSLRGKVKRKLSRV